MIGKFLQLHFPQAQTPAVASSGIGGDQKALSVGIESFPFMAPPAPNGGHGKGARVMISPDIDKPSVAPDVINAVRIGARHLGLRKVMPAHMARLLRRMPLLAAIVVISDEFYVRNTNRNWLTLPARADEKVEKVEKAGCYSAHRRANL